MIDRSSSLSARAGGDKPVVFSKMWVGIPGRRKGEAGGGRGRKRAEGGGRGRKGQVKQRVKSRTMEGS